MIRALIFDFDGLIVDTESPALQSWQEIFREYGYELSLDRWALNVGRGESLDVVGDLQQLVGRTLDAEALKARRRARHIQMVEAQPISARRRGAHRGSPRNGTPVGSGFQLTTAMGRGPPGALRPHSTHRRHPNEDRP